MCHFSKQQANLTVHLRFKQNTSRAHLHT